jgi:hypothetical protein
VIARIVYRIKAGILVRRAHGELIAIGLAENDGPGFFQSRHHRGVVRGDEVRQDLGTRGGTHVFGREDILHRDGNASQRRQRIAFVGQRVNPRRLLVCALLAQGEISANGGIFSVDLLVKRVH